MAQQVVDPAQAGALATGAVAPHPLAPQDLMPQRRRPLASHLLQPHTLAPLALPGLPAQQKHGQQDAAAAAGLLAEEAPHPAGTMAPLHAAGGATALPHPTAGGAAHHPRTSGSAARPQQHDDARAALQAARQVAADLLLESLLLRARAAQHGEAHGAPGVGGRGAGVEW